MQNVEEFLKKAKLWNLGKVMFRDLKSEEQMRIFNVRIGWSVKMMKMLQMGQFLIENSRV